MSTQTQTQSEVLPFPSVHPQVKRKIPISAADGATFIIRKLMERHEKIITRVALGNLSEHVKDIIAFVAPNISTDLETYADFTRYGWVTCEEILAQNGYNGKEKPYPEIFRTFSILERR